ncbi:MAG: hypothetical protein KAU14_04900, partial [Thermoplasmata archaeon]|nr:hypothetical protein [Thermoplasmata archaeon]
MKDPLNEDNEVPETGTSSELGETVTREEKPEPSSGSQSRSEAPASQSGPAPGAGTKTEDSDDDKAQSLRSEKAEAKSESLSIEKVKNLDEIKKILSNHRGELRERFRTSEIGLFGSY